jgi:predicted PurR-regulated permease PerM
VALDLAVVPELRKISAVAALSRDDARPAFLAFALFERARGQVVVFIITYGRVPFIYYVAHIFLIHAAAIVLAWVQCGTASFLIRHGPGARPSTYGLSLAGVYVIWLLVVAALYPLCRWFADLKQRRSDWWLSYL